MANKVEIPTPAAAQNPVTPTTERPKRVVKRTSKSYSTPSIKDALQGKFKDEEKQLSAKEQFKLYSKAEEFENFTKEGLEKKWKEFLTQLDDRPNLKSTLSKVPELKDDFHLYLEIDNTIQEGIIDTIKPKLISFLRKELRNSKIELTTKVTEEIKNRIIYTDEDKFDEMKKKNPLLADLKKKLDLDLGQL